KDMGGLPDALFIIDTNKEDLAVSEARNLGIPVFAVIDTNSTPDGITFPIPGNDDAIRAISLYCDLFADAILDGLQAEMAAAGVDAGAATNPKAEKLPKAKKSAKVDAPKAEEASTADEKKSDAPEAAAEEAAEEKPKKQATA
ncbi:MAG: 30S ribosomal protein S2, partial [Alphaproteobacteria bacterium]|nr:30S ribosomal protein S2 [Alphaproteobacteria bacterium]